jgi:hypothetical protein
VKAPAGRDEILETFYAEHVGALLRNSSAWLRRLVASYAIIDAGSSRAEARPANSRAIALTCPVSRVVRRC